jgi:hypothetical protein
VPIDLFKECTIKTPGGHQPSGSALEINLPSTIRIARLALTFKDPPILSSDSTLYFTFQERSQGLVKADILRGDIGFPEINIENLDGEYHRMKRGNLKDFLAIEKITEQQEVTIPLSVLIYNVDLKSNACQSPDFWSRPIKKIDFDFLCSPESAIRLVLGKLSILPGRIDSVDLLDLVSVEKAGRPDTFPTFVSESQHLSLAFCSRAASVHAYNDLELIANISESSGLANLDSFSLSKGKTYRQFTLPALGQHELRLKLLSCSKQIAEASIPVVRTIKTSSRIPKLGISDSALFGESLILGGTLRRMVVSLKWFLKRGETFESIPNCRLLEAIPMHPHVDWIIALKEMPKWLSRKPDQHDYHRYAPSSASEYRKFVKYLVQKFISAGVKYLEPWNEANVIHEWNDSLESLLEMQTIFYEETRGTDLVLLSPSTTTWDFQFFERLRQIGLYKFCDGIALHGYTYEPYMYQEYMRQSEDLHRKTGLPLYVTEIGFRFPTYKLHAQSLFLSLFTIEIFFSRHFLAILWFRYQNHSHETPTSYNQNSSVGYSMIGYNSSYARCMYAAFQALNHFLYQLEPIEIRRKNYSSLYIGKYSDSSIESNRVLAISYSRGDGHALAKDFFARSRVFDYFGNKLASGPITGDSGYPDLLYFEMQGDAGSSA